MKTVTATSAGGVVVDDQGRVALTARLSFKNEVQWGLPKGIVERGESRREAAIRETVEETGLEVEVVQELTPIDYWFVQPARGEEPATRVHKFVHFFLMRPVGGDIGNHDHETLEVQFLPAAAARRKASFSSEKKIIDEAVRELNRH